MRFRIFGVLVSVSVRPGTSQQTVRSSFGMYVSRDTFVAFWLRVISASLLLFIRDVFANALILATNRSILVIR